MHVDVSLPYEHERRGSFELALRSEAASLEGAPPVPAEPRGWGFQ
jgi:hypothetical protein